MLLGCVEEVCGCQKEVDVCRMGSCGREGGVCGDERSVEMGGKVEVEGTLLS